MAIFSKKQAEVSTGLKTYDTTVNEVWKHVAWSKHVVKLWQYVEHPAGWMFFAWHSFDHRSNKDKQLSPTTMRWLLKPQQKQFTQSVNTQHYFVPLIDMFWWFKPVKPCLTAEFNNSRVLCIISNKIIPTDMRFQGYEIWSLSRPNSLLGQWDSGWVWGRLPWILRS